MSMIEMTGICKAYGGVPALSDVRLSLEPGRAMALIGQNGAGKSTLIRILTGATGRDSGQVVMDGQDVDFASPYEALESGISTIYQEINLIPQRTVAENIFLGREPTRLGMIAYRSMNARAAQALAEFGVDIDVSRPLGDFNAATRQMVAIARAVQLESKVVIFDESSSSLDRREVEFLFSAMRKLKAKGVAIVFVSHKLDELYAVCDDVTIMRDGRTVGEHVLSELSKKQLVEIMLGKTFDAFTRSARTEAPRETAARLRAKDMQTNSGLASVNLHVAAGEILGLAGLLGSGRTETAHALFGADKLTHGSIEIQQKPVAFDRPADAIVAGIGLCSEDRKVDGIVPDMSVAENLTLALLPSLTHWGIVDTKRRDEIADVFIDKLNIKVASRTQKISQLSGGNQQKVLLARWLAMNLSVLIVDEPTRGIDVGAKAEILSVIKDLAAEGLGVLLISSEMEEVVAVADRVTVLWDGQTIADLSGPQITEDNILSTIASGDAILDHAEGAA